MMAAFLLWGIGWEREDISLLSKERTFLNPLETLIFY